MPPQAIQPTDIDSLPRHRLLPRIYRRVLSLTRKHGLFTLARFHDRFFGGEQCVDIPSGARLVIPDDPHYFGFLTGLHETHVAEAIRGFVKPGDVCVDVGANIGYFSMMMAKHAGASGKTFAFEPVPDTFEALQKNAFLAGMDGLCIEPRHAGVSDQIGELVIVRREHSTLNEVRAVDDRLDAGVVRVKSLTLESFVKGEALSQPIALLKIDVEGHELAVIQGGVAVLRSGQVRQLILEVTPGEDAVQIDRILSECGASTSCWVDGDWRNTVIRGLSNRTDILAKFP